MTEYPVVADPTYSVGWGYYAHLNRAETAGVPRSDWLVGASTVGYVPLIALAIIHGLWWRQDDATGRYGDHGQPIPPGARADT